MASIAHVTIEAQDPAAADHFYSDTLGLGDRVRVRASDAPTAGFRGATLSLVVAQPTTADHVIDAALGAGATSLKPAARSLWGYGGALQAPDGTIITVASTSKKDSGPATRDIDDLVLQLGVADVAASKAFYSERGLTVAKGFGRRYAEFDTGPVTLTLTKRAALAKVAGVSPEGTGSPRIAIVSDVGPFTDPDGFAWETASGKATTQH